ncbi:RteC domain-containing protein [Labilibaculum sp. DW002]|uniref:RteC domain-containing protein n=1 Tax=Paralabilibaculum antarcticum TaxID=2912572 RepID=A0ABT5VQA3_9BACT|nr:RteC domain-containing protein [Labilibaculum sp. DW002]MDE5417605.1 RteC domain-containing protein [Labilibaculum sp. DW002]
MEDLFMIQEDNFLNLKAELCNATIALEKIESGYKIYFNNYSDYRDFECHLGTLYYEFINEVRNNLISFKIDKEAEIYLEMLLHVFEILDEQIKVCPDLVSPHTNVKIVSKSNSKLSCIHSSFDYFSEMMAYFQFQKKIINKSRKFILTYQKKCKKSFNKVKKYQSWKDELKEFYPEMARVKDKTNKFSLLPEKIKYLQKEKRNLSKQFQKEGKNLYSSPLNFFFESRIECLKDLLLDQDDISKLNQNLRLNEDSQIEKSNSHQLKWTESKTALVELIYGLHSSKSINDGKEGIKRIAQLFESMFDIDLGDVYHTFSEVRNRKIEQTKFLDLLKDSLLTKMKEIDEKITL